MSRQITPEKQAQFRQYWIDGFTIPEIAKMCGSTAKTVKKYLGIEVEVYIKEHTKAREAREQAQRVADIVPTPVNLAEVVEPEPDSTQLTYDQFESYVIFEFDNAPDDIEYLKNLYYELKEEYKQEYRFVIRLRELYEARLNQIGKSKTRDTSTNSDKLIEEDTEVSSIDNSVEVAEQSFTQGLQIKSAEQTQQTIKAFKSKYNISQMPVPRISTLCKDEWRSLHRALEHLHYWYVAHHDNHQAAKQSIKDKSLADYQEWFNSFE